MRPSACRMSSHPDRVGRVPHQQRRGPQLLHPLRRGLHGVDPRLEHQGGEHFRGGSGSGINLSKIRGSMEPLSKGGTASGWSPSCAAPARWAGTIKSGGKHAPGGQDGRARRRPSRHPRLHLVQGQGGGQGRGPARRRLQHVDRRRRLHLDPVPEREQLGPGDRRVHAGGRERRGLAAALAGDRRARGDPIPARELMQDIAEAAWRCADPGVQYDTTINQWHTSLNSGRINASICSEYMHVDDSACNLASLNLMKFRRPDGPSTSRASTTRSTSSCSPRRSSSARRATRPGRSPRTRGPSASSAWATRTSAPT